MEDVNTETNSTTVPTLMEDYDISSDSDVDSLSSLKSELDKALDDAELEKDSLKDDNLANNETTDQKLDKSETTDQKLDDSEQIGEELIMGARLLFHGPGGSGKSELSKRIVRYLKNKSINVQVLTYGKKQADKFGHDALHIHEFFGLGVDEKDNTKIPNLLKERLKKNCTYPSVLNIGYSNLISTLEGGMHVKNYVNAKECARLLKRIVNVQVIMIDEISNVGVRMFELINTLLQEYKETDKLFGGVGLLLIGDMLQTAPVKDSYPFQSPLWRQLKMDVCIFRTLYRFGSNTEWANLTLRLRKGEQTESDLKFLESLVGKRASQKTDVKNCVTRKEVRQYNDYAVASLPGDPITYESMDTCSKDGVMLSKEITEKFALHSVDELKIDKMLTLKEGIKVMLLKNNKKLEISNKDIATVVELPPLPLKSNSLITLKMDKDNRIIKLGRTIMKMYVGQNNQYEFVRSQFPIQPAYAGTTQGMQGETLDEVVLNYSKSFAGAGNVYTGFTRARHPDGISLEGFNRSAIRVDQHALAFVNALEGNNVSSTSVTLSSSSNTQLPSFVLEEITAFTDGACRNNGESNAKASYSFVVFDKTKNIIHQSSSKIDSNPTNNRAEWTALVKCIEYLDKHNLENVTIYTDSNLAVKTINEWYDNWVKKNILHKKANLDLVSEFMTLFKKHKYKVVHCNSHLSQPNDKHSLEWFIWNGNNVCDVDCNKVLDN